MANISATLDTIIRFGTPLQRQIAANLQRSGIRIYVKAVQSEADTLITDSNQTQQKIDSVVLNEFQALAELSTRIHPNITNSETFLERALVHEGRHSYHLARVVSEFSQAHLTKKKPYNPTRFTVEYAAYQAYADHVIQAAKLNHPRKQELIDDSLSSGVTKMAGKKLVVDSAGIYKVILNGYGLDGKTNVGETLGDFFRITPRGAW